MFFSSAQVRNRKRLLTSRLRLEAFEDRTTPSTVAGGVFLDANSDGIRQSTEFGMGGVRVYLDANANGVFDAPTATSPGDPSAITSPDGKYIIQTPLTGSVVVAQVVPAGFVQTAGPSGPVTLSPAGAVTSVPLFGNGPVTPPPPPPAPTGGVIRGSVFVDGNGDGTRQSTEVGQGGVLVFIDANGDGKFNAPTSTGPGEISTISKQDGSYEFKLGKDGTYSVLEVAPTGWVVTTGTPAAVSVAGGQVANGPVFGNQPPPPPPPTGGLIRGSVFVDANGDGVRQSTEVGQGGVLVFIDANGDGKFNAPTAGTVGEPATQTKADGTYEFKLGKDGTYSVLEVAPTSWTITTGTPAAVTVAGGATADGPVFGNQPPLPPPPPPAPTGGVIRGSVFVDINGDGIRQSNEPGMGGVLVFIDSNADGKFTPGTATTAGEKFVISGPTGNYELKVAADGAYSVLEVVPQGWTATTGTPGSVTVAGGAVANGPIFGNQPPVFVMPGLVEGRVFYDKNSNGKLDTGEPGIPGIRIYSDLNGNGALDNGEPRTLSNWAGQYRLLLAPGTHTLREIVPAGATETVAPGTVTVVGGQVVHDALFGLNFAAPFAGKASTNNLTVGQDVQTTTPKTEVVLHGVEVL
ncbi:MAG: hypothetical protein K1X57_16060 [Gemmataceae bacterium]|nr:hypothetical protein [Gemmataceae bacterium]